MFEDILRDIAAKAAAAVRMPEYRALAQRARARRLRRRVASGATALAVGAAIAVFVVSVRSTPDGTGPVHPGPSPTTTTSPSLGQPGIQTRAWLIRHPTVLLHQPYAQIASMSYADADHAAALWQACSQVVDAPTGTCPEVMTWTSDGWRTSQAMVIPDKLGIFALDDGSVVVAIDGAHSFLARPDGSRRRLGASLTPLAAMPGGSIVNLPSALGAAPAGVLDRRTAVVHRPLVSPDTRCVDDDRWDAHATIWEYGAPQCGRAPSTVAWSSDLGRTWSLHDTGPAPILGLAVSESRTAVLLAGLTRSQRMVPHQIDVTDDGGRAWRRESLRGLSSGDFTPQIRGSATAGGKLYIATPVGIWVAPGDWSSYHRIHATGVTDDSNVTAAHGVVCAWGGYATTIQVSTDDGRTWHSVVPRP